MEKHKLTICYERIKFLRLLNDLSLDELAIKVGVSKQMLSQIELNNRTPKLEVLEKIAEVFEVPFSFFTEPKIVISFCGAKKNAQVIHDQIQLKDLSFKIERIYGEVQQGEKSLSRARLDTRNLILKRLASSFKNQYV